MSNHSENTKRIAKNTMMLYCRMLFSMLISLYTSRVVLNTLGVEDYGIYNVVGGFVAMFSLISGSLSSSVGRFLTFELGRGDMDRLKRTYSTSLLIHIVLAVIIFVSMETIGVWFLNNKLTIPTERIYAANWVFQASIFSFMFGLLAVPYNALIVAHERMSAFAYIGILEITLKLAIVLFVAHCPFLFDKLITYSLLLTGLGILMRFVYVSYCRRNFSESEFHLKIDKSYLKEMASFAGWNFIGCSALLLKNQGTDVLLNLYFGPVVNAARGIASVVNGAISSFSGNFMTALNPQITKSYAANDREYSQLLVERGARFSFFIMFIFALPIFLEADFVLTIWLKQYPEHTVNFVRLILVLSFCDIVSNTLITLQSATGKIRNYQLAVGITLLMNFPLSYICLYWDCPPESVLVVAVFVSIACMVLRLYFVQQSTQLSIRRFLLKVCVRILFVVVCSSILPIIFRSNMEYGCLRFLVVGAISVLSSGVMILLLGCTKGERNFIIENVHILRKRLVI